jgi:hypothetical protein
MAKSQPNAKVKPKPHHGTGTITFITNGYRVRTREDGNRPVAILNGAKFTTQEELQKAWEKQVTGIDEEDFVLGAGEPGIFSGRFGKQMEQITQVDHVWCPSTGLGMVCLGAKYPQYDLGDYDSNIKRALDPGLISERDWWKFVCGLSGNSITSVVQSAVKHSHRIIMALPPLQYAVFRDDLKDMIREVGAEAVRDHIRLVGPELESVVLPKLLPCVMPYDREALDRLVPGARAHGTRRLARLLVDVCPPQEDGASNPVEDYRRMVAAYADKKREPIHYDTGAEEKASKLKRLDDTEMRDKVEEYAEVCGPIAVRVVRMMREDGYSINTDVAESVLAELEGAPKRRRK